MERRSISVQPLQGLSLQKLKKSDIIFAKLTSIPQLEPLDQKSTHWSMQRPLGRAFLSLNHHTMGVSLSMSFPTTATLASGITRQIFGSWISHQVSADHLTRQIQTILTVITVGLQTAVGWSSAVVSMMDSTPASISRTSMRRAMNPRLSCCLRNTLSIIIQT